MEDEGADVLEGGSVDVRMKLLVRVPLNDLLTARSFFRIVYDITLSKTTL